MKKVLILLCVCLAIAVIGGVVFSRLMIGNFTPELFVEQIESRLNCRAEIESVDAYWLGKSRILIKGLSLADRDDSVDSGVALRDRLPLVDPPVRVETIELALQPGSLLLKRLSVKKLSFDGVELKMLLREDGTSSLESLFEKRAGEAMPIGEPAVSLEPVAEEENAVFDAGSIPVAILADRAGVTNSRLFITVEKTGATIELEDANFEFFGIDVNPRNLAAQNRAEFEFSGKIALGKGEAASKALEAQIRGRGETKPFDPEKAKWAPSWKSEIALVKGSRLDTVPIVEKLKEKLEAVNRPGIDLSGIMAKGELVEDAVTELSYKRGRYQFEKEFVLDFGGTRIDVHPESWIDAGENLHEIRGAVTGSREFTEEVQTKAQAYLDELTGGRAPSQVVKTLMIPITKEDRIHLQVISRGDLSDPKPDLVTPIGNLRELIQGSGNTLKNLKEFGRGFLDGVLKRKPEGE